MVGGNWSSWGKWEEIGRARGREREICSLPIYPIPFARSPRPRFRSCVPLFGSLIPSFAGGGGFLSWRNLSELIHGRRKPCNPRYPHTIWIKSWKIFQPSNREWIRCTLGGAHAWTSNDQHVWLSGFIFCVYIVIVKIVRKTSTLYTL